MPAEPIQEPMQIVQALAAHLGDLLELVETCRSALIEAGILQWDGQYPNPGILQRDQAAGCLYAALIGDKPVGMVTLNAEQDPEYSRIRWQFPGPCSVIHRLCVSPIHQGSGIGTALMRFAEAKAETRAFSSVRLDVYSGNPGAVAFYERMGYTPAGQVRFPRRGRPFHCMEKALPPARGYHQGSGFQEGEMDPKREMLRHTLATLAYRGGKTLRGVPADFGAPASMDRPKAPVQILSHISDLLEWALHHCKGESNWIQASPGPWDAEVERFFSVLKQLDEFLRSETVLACPVERLFQGPIADALTHVGQIALLRRMAGCPVLGENYFVAEIEPGRVGPDQAAPVREFE